MAKAGRKRKGGARSPRNGRLVPQASVEREADIMGVVLAQREKIVGKDQARSQLAEHPLGRLLLWKNITKEQYEAGVEYGKRLRLYSIVIGCDVTAPRAPWPEIASSGGDGYEMEPERVMSIRKAYADINRAIQDLRFSGIETGGILSVMRKVCAREEGGGALSPRELGDLRTGLNAASRELRLSSQEAA